MSSWPRARPQATSVSTAGFWGLEAHRKMSSGRWAGVDGEDFFSLMSVLGGLLTFGWCSLRFSRFVFVCWFWWVCFGVHVARRSLWLVDRDVFICSADWCKHRGSNLKMILYYEGRCQRDLRFLCKQTRSHQTYAVGPFVVSDLGTLDAGSRPRSICHWWVQCWGSLVETGCSCFRRPSWAIGCSQVMWGKWMILQCWDEFGSTDTWCTLRRAVACLGLKGTYKTQ